MTPLTMTADRLAEIRAYADGRSAVWSPLTDPNTMDAHRAELLAEVDALHDLLGDRDCDECGHRYDAHEIGSGPCAAPDVGSGDLDESEPRCPCPRYRRPGSASR